MDCKTFCMVASVCLSQMSLASTGLIIKFKSEIKDAQSVSRNIHGFFNRPQVINQKLGLYNVDFPLVMSSRAKANSLDEIRALDFVEYAQEDHILSFRGGRSFPEPWDADYSRQWSFKDFDDRNLGSANIQKAWDKYGNGEGTVDGNDIVIAVIDGGFDMDHEDLEGAWAENLQEIAENGIDDDGNGYIDDKYGYNSKSNSGADVPLGDHGTHVAGIVGATGDNGLGVAGVNWGVKVLPIFLDLGMTKTSDVIRAYTYVIDAKERWFETGGREGLNIVVTNSSFGFDRANCESEDFPVWNDLYDRMGELGILSAVATANRGWNIDSVGDVPSGCSSDYIIAVTNTTRGGEINRRAGYGRESIDISAPGTDIHSATSYGYDVMTGTSMATPHIAGAVAYLYSVVGLGFTSDYHSNPGNAALEIKDALLNSARQSDEFEQTVSGGTLDLYEASEIAAGL